MARFLAASNSPVGDDRRSAGGGFTMQLTPALITVRQLNVDNLLLRFCLDNRVSPSDLGRVAVQLAHMEAFLDAKTTRSNHEQSSL